MSLDIGTTPRKPLTPTQRLKLFEDHKGICCICTNQIRSGEDWWDEHQRALALGGSNELSNRGPAHVKCAEVKTRQEDMPRIVKAKAQKKASLGIAPPKQKIANRGFAKAAKPRMEKPAALPRRDPFTRQIIEGSQ